MVKSNLMDPIRHQGSFWMKIHILLSLVGYW